MILEIGAPACLPLGVVQLNTTAATRAALVGLTVQHPPVHLLAQKADRWHLSGPRAHLGYRYAAQFLQYHHLEAQAQVEIELAIPALMGLGSDEMLGLSLGRALAHLHNLPQPARSGPALAAALGFNPHQALAAHAFAQGGLLLVAAESPGQVIRRAEIAHDDREAWAFVFYFPLPPEETPENLEQSRLAALLRAAPHLELEAGSAVVEALWQAVADDDINAFGQALMQLQTLNRAALTAAGQAMPATPATAAVLELMRTYGVAAWGQCPGGLACYGLVKGARASIDLRTRLRQQLGPFGGHFMATITANVGARHAETGGDLNLNKYNPVITDQ